MNQFLVSYAAVEWVVASNARLGIRSVKSKLPAGMCAHSSTRTHSQEPRTGRETHLEGGNTCTVFWATCHCSLRSVLECFFAFSEFEVAGENSRHVDLGHSNLKSRLFMATHCALGSSFLYL